MFSFDTLHKHLLTVNNIGQALVVSGLARIDVVLQKIAQNAAQNSSDAVIDTDTDTDKRKPSTPSVPSCFELSQSDAAQPSIVLVR